MIKRLLIAIKIAIAEAEIERSETAIRYHRANVQSARDDLRNAYIERMNLEKEGDHWQSSK